MRAIKRSDLQDCEIWTREDEFGGNQIALSVELGMAWMIDQRGGAHLMSPNKFGYTAEAIAKLLASCGYVKAAA